MKNKFALNIKELRLLAGLKQIDLAKILNTTQRKISYWEIGQIEPDLDTLWLIADFFNITIDELIGREFKIS
ncbi:MAG: helix-turn-helix transcriptional regulator [Clostridia bacterium]|nr:helix-turn-helix transcriptional regulator [Clostridia bacterium]